MNILIILYILFIHWIADFVCQSHEMSINKSKSNWWLSYHVFVYSLITYSWWLILCLITARDNNLPYVLLFPIIFITHWITDYFTSRWTSRLWAKGDIHNFFVVIGLDQFIHFATLLLTYKCLVQ